MKLNINLPQEFVDLCKDDGVEPEVVIRGFIADLMNLRGDDYNSNGSDERMMAQAYYERVGYPYWNQ